MTNHALTPRQGTRSKARVGAAAGPDDGQNATPQLRTFPDKLGWRGSMTNTRASAAVAALAVVVIACGTLNSAAAQISYLMYHNARFGFTIQYPQSFRISESDNGDGISLLPPGSGADFRAFSGFNALDQSGPQLFNSAVNEIAEHGGVVTYATKLSNGFVVSGVIGSRIRYQRVLFTDHHGRPLDSAGSPPTLTPTFWAEYPASRKAELDPIVSVMSRSLRVGPGID
jgi:hypothetical protein